LLFFPFPEKFEGYEAALTFRIFRVLLVFVVLMVFGIEVSRVVEGIGFISGFGLGLSRVTSCTPLMVSKEPIHPITPRYIIRIHVTIKGANAAPKTVTRSGDPAMDRSLLRNRYALKKVKASRATPMKRVTYPETRALSSMGWTSMRKTGALDIKSSDSRNHISFKYPSSAT